MQEVTIRLRFTKPCLGYVERRTKRQQVIYVMPRDPSNRIMFLPSWWHHRLEYAAKVLNRYQEVVKRISWDQTVDGRTGSYKRRVARLRQDGTVKSVGYAAHEAFRAGDEIGINAVLPSPLSIAAFMELLTIVGRYKGISPYQSEEDVYGTFDVVSVQPTIRVLSEV